MEATEKAKGSLEELSGIQQWPIILAPEWPTQDNGDDCGVFSAVGCECIA